MNTADLSPLGEYRYLLTREWDPAAEKLTFVMLNPSTADADLDDPTIRRCISFAKREDFGGLRVVNLYAFRATDPKVMKRQPDPVGPDNDHWIRDAVLGRTVIVAWGANATAERALELRTLLAGELVYCLGTTKQGHPRHPLYVRGDQPLTRWPAEDPDGAVS